MAGQLAKHGSEAGYKAEIKRGDVCTRCRNAHRVYAKQYTAGGRKAGLKYGFYDVVDNLYSPGKTGFATKQTQDKLRASRQIPSVRPAEVRSNVAAESASTEEDLGEFTVTRASLGDMLGSRLRDFVGSNPGNDFVDNAEMPDYLHAVESDPEPADPQWSTVDDSDIVINEAGMKRIEDNLGTYVSVVGMTMEMVDPYCGRVLADQIPEMVSRWTKVIAHYPSAAKLFLDGKGGVIMLWIAAIQSTWPVLMAIYKHHLSGEIKIQDGKVMRRQTVNGLPGYIDSLTPPMADSYQYSAA